VSRDYVTWSKRDVLYILDTVLDNEKKNIHQSTGGDANRKRFAQKSLEERNREAGFGTNSPLQPKTVRLINIS